MKEEQSQRRRNEDDGIEGWALIKYITVTLPHQPITPSVLLSSFSIDMRGETVPMAPICNDAVSGGSCESLHVAIHGFILLVSSSCCVAVFVGSIAGPRVRVHLDF